MEATHNLFVNLQLATAQVVFVTSTFCIWLRFLLLDDASNLCFGLRPSSQCAETELRTRRPCYQQAGRDRVLMRACCASSHMSTAQARICPHLCMHSFHWRQQEQSSCNRRQKFGSLILIELSARSFADAGCKFKPQRVRKMQQDIGLPATSSSAQAM